MITKKKRGIIIEEKTVWKYFVIIYEKKKEIILTNEEKESFENQKVCYICEKEFSTDKSYRKVRDHGHYTGIYRGAAHSSCNVRCKYQERFL